ncbi:conserved hypothetical protein [Theileria orientalis strain Shintoku]|uniref:Uncharacterized protein n=1 Tax=Theileria orientalis strain Shintoku TaxID=869250 RepID=J4DPY6_THEOR|nr:conserved hypothetical protein [Theileria orientalis strain Shintoku]BAM41519.1 conserved hypothetical protein [Theileria orientalis strain Shintoku]|eukprot:XP_009691820.1 conserved hypothetical protein [Theileria orientalis strain Shintoku]
MSRSKMVSKYIPKIVKRSISTKVKVEYRSIAESVNEEVNKIVSLWGMRNIKIKSSKYIKDDLMLKLASKQLGQPEVDHLLSLSPENKNGKWPNPMTSTKIIYEESINKDINYTDNDIWLGYSKYISYFNIALGYKSRNVENLIKEYEEGGCKLIRKVNGAESQEIGENGINLEKLREEVLRNEKTDNYTIFVFPYRRKTSKAIVETLSKRKELLSGRDFKSLVYTSGSTGSSRMLRFMSTLMNEAIRSGEPETPIHSVESYAWPWMNKSDKEKELNHSLPLLLDALSSSTVIKYTVDNESKIYDYIMSGLKALDAKIQEATTTSIEDGGAVGSTSSSDSTIRTNASTATEELANYDNVVLEKVLSLLIIKRNLDQLRNDQIRTFSDFVCDRMHRIKPKILANLAYSLGHSKNLDEFWMFMISKQIQLLINTNTSVSENDMESGEEDWSFDVDDVAAILDAYSTSGLEDYNFYTSVCTYIKDKFHSYPLHHKSIIIRSLAAVRHRDVDLIRDFIESLKEYTKELISKITSSGSYGNSSNNGSHNTTSSSNNGSRSGKNISISSRNNKVKTHLIKPIDSYMVATGIVSVCDLDYRVDEIDSLWKVLTYKVKDSSFDICAISWLPIATIIYPSLVSLTEFLPVWAKHVNYTINKLRSRAFMMTIQRRQLLLRHAFNLGILPNEYMSTKCKKYIDEICDKNYIKCKEDYMPESSTFHLEVCACLRALGVTHQREINILPFVMDIVISAEKVAGIKSKNASEAERETDSARCGNIPVEGDKETFPLRYNRNSPNHRKHKEEVYTLVPEERSQ